MTTVHCGMGCQQIRWLADVALYKYDDNYGMNVGTPHSLRFANGVEVCIIDRGDQKAINSANLPLISDELTDDVHLYLVFKEDIMSQDSSRGNKKNDKKGGRR